MKNKKFKILCLCAGLLLFPVFLTAKDPINIVFILADDQGWNAFSAQTDPDDPASKSDYYQTPNTDRLIREGMTFAQSYAPAPVCSPTRHSIQWGISPAKTRVTHNNSQHKQFCEPELAMANLIKKADERYVTAHFGKWHISVPPEQCGYDESDGDTANGEGSDSKDAEDPKRTSEVTDRAVEFLNRKAEAEQPFFMQVSYYANHLEFKSSQETLEKYKALPPGKRHSDPIFAGMNEDLDTGFGRILDTLDRLGLSEETYVIYTGDNGFDESPRELHGNPKRKAWPLSYSKGFVSEGGIRVPFIVRGPGVVAGSASRAPVVGYDVLPTVLNLINSNYALPKEVEGGSLVSVLENAGKGEVKRENEYMIFHYPTGVWPAQSAIIVDDYKLTKYWAYDRLELFDLRKDLSETKDISGSNPERAERMHRLLMGYLDGVSAVKPTEDDLLIDRDGELMKKYTGSAKKILESGKRRETRN